MIASLRLMTLLIVASSPLAAQTIVPVPRPTAEERAVAAEERAAAAALAEEEAVAAAAEVEESRPLTQDEIASFMVQVRACWNTAALPEEAQDVGVLVGFSMTSDAEPIPNTFEMIEATDTDPDRADLAFLAARRAVIRCGEDGYDLPAAAFPYWERVQINFDPTDAGGN